MHARGAKTGVVPYNERSARFDRWRLKHPWRAAVILTLPVTLFWFMGLLGGFGTLGLGSAVLMAVVLVVCITGVVVATWRYLSQPSNYRRLWRWEESGQH
jgi:hypothetical protein